MPTLLDSLTSLAAPTIGPIAQRLGEPDTAVARGVETSVASLLGGLITKTKDPTSIERIFDLIRTRPVSANLAGDVQNSVREITTEVPTSGATGTLLTTLFGGNASTLGGLIARTAGFRNPSSGTALLGMAAPLVLGFLGKKVRDNGLNLSGLSNLLMGERDSVLAAAPPGLMNLVDTGLTIPRVEAGETRRGAAAAGAGAVSTVGKTGRGWLWAVIGVAALALIWFFASRGGAPTIAGAALDTAAARTGAAVKAAGGEVSEAAAKLGAFGKRMLPSGVELNIPERGIESKLIAFIEDGARPVNDTTWFEFDRLNFETGSATILPQSQEQLNNIKAVLEAYPNVNVKIGGYTDNVGDDAANMRLSQQRADAVMQALITEGIAASRLQAEGYGEQHPIADNATEEGRAMNRRIAVRVTRK